MIIIKPVSGQLLICGEEGKQLRAHLNGVMASQNYPLSAEVLFLNIRRALTDSPDIEGIVFHLEKDGQPISMAKIKRKDFGLPWPTAEAADPNVVEGEIVSTPLSTLPDPVTTSATSASGLIILPGGEMIKH
jgi:hypothetical protein